jgi:2-polyprenyl-6-methoxyphenol hydroxylase-like FAD-dependent oxidoreductase
MGVKRVWAVCEDGRRFEGDLLIGADGIWSKVHPWRQALGVVVTPWEDTKQCATWAAETRKIKAVRFVVG